MTTREKRIFWTTIGLGVLLVMSCWLVVLPADQRLRPLVIVLMLCLLVVAAVVGRILVVVSRRYPLRKVLPLAALCLAGSVAASTSLPDMHNWVLAIVANVVLCGCLVLTVQLFMWLNPDIQPKQKPPVLLTGSRRRLALGAGVAMLVVDLLLISIFWSYGTAPCQRLDLLRRDMGCQMLLETPRGADALSYSADGTLLAAGVYPNDVFLWSLPDGRRVLNDRLPADVHAYEQSVALAPDGALIAIGVGEDAVEVRRTSDGTVHHRLSTPDGHVTYISFSPDGALLGVISGDAIRVFHMPAATLLYTLPGPEHALFFSPDGETLLLSAFEEVQVHDARDGSRVRSIPIRRSPSEVALSADATVLATPYIFEDDPAVELRRVSDGALIQTIAAAPGSNGFSELALSPDGTLLLTAESFTDAGNPVTLWRVADGEPLRSFDVPDRADVVAFAPDGRSVAIATYDGVYLWALE